MKPLRLPNPFLASRVIDACNRAIGEIETVRLGRTWALKQKHRMYQKYWFFGPWLSRTDEEALDHAERYDEIDFIHATDHRGYDYVVLKSIKEMARKVHGDLVYLTREEFNLISDQYTV